jgi:hypothetical protein
MMPSRPLRSGLVLDPRDKLQRPSRERSDRPARYRRPPLVNQRVNSNLTPASEKGGPPICVDAGLQDYWLTQRVMTVRKPIIALMQPRYQSRRRHTIGLATLTTVAAPTGQGHSTRQIKSPRRFDQSPSRLCLLRLARMLPAGAGHLLAGLLLCHRRCSSMKNWIGTGADPTT